MGEARGSINVRHGDGGETSVDDGTGNLRL
jgi:hypothetical protein